MAEYATPSTQCYQVSALTFCAYKRWRYGLSLQYGCTTLRKSEYNFLVEDKKVGSRQYKKNLQTRTVMPKIKERRLRKAQVHMVLPSFQLSSCRAYWGEENVSWGCWGQSPQAVTPSWQFRWINEFVDCWDSLWQVRQCNLHRELPKLYANKQNYIKNRKPSLVLHAVRTKCTRCRYSSTRSAVLHVYAFRSWNHQHLMPTSRNRQELCLRAFRTKQAVTCGRHYHRLPLNGPLQRKHFLTLRRRCPRPSTQTRGSWQAIPLRLIWILNVPVSCIACFRGINWRARGTSNILRRFVLRFGWRPDPDSSNTTAFNWVSLPTAWNDGSEGHSSGNLLSLSIIIFYDLHYVTKEHDFTR